jgi:nanoRNase/pAp phosphatase (c-di-AMP/oligoRNAs hydrolase)
VTQLELAELRGPAFETGELVAAAARACSSTAIPADADRILILLHNDPDPDALASGLALRALLRRTKTTAIIGAMQGLTRPENLRMANLLDIQVEAITPESLATFERIATVDVQPHYFSEFLNRVDLVIDQHPEQPGYSAIFRDIRPDYGSSLRS